MKEFLSSSGQVITYARGGDVTGRLHADERLQLKVLCISSLHKKRYTDLVSSGGIRCVHVVCAYSAYMQCVHVVRALA